MVKSHPQHCFVHFAVDYASHFRLKLLDATDKLQQSHVPELIQQSQAATIFRWPSQSRSATLGLNRFSVSTLGLTAWTNSDAFVRDAVSTIRTEFPLAKLKRVGFKVDIYTPIGLSHAECVDLLFGSFLGQRQQVLDALSSTAADPVLIFETVLPDSREAKIEFASMSVGDLNMMFSKANLDAFTDKPLLDENVKGFLNGIMGKDVFACSIDLFTKDLASNEFEAFLDTCVDQVDQMSARIVSLIKSKPGD